MKEIKKLTINFYVNDQFIETTVAPDLTALELLRDHLHLTGAKEVCREGDCGACTIAVGRFEGKHFVYRALTSCILPAAKLHGSHVITVEGLAEAGKLHFIQQMMLDHHAIQCGYCTAGIVMSLFALLASHENPTEQDIFTALEGNLCRCTGYKAIHEAAQASIECVKNIASANKKQSVLPSYAVAIQQKIKAIGDIVVTQAAGNSIENFVEEYIAPHSLTEVFNLMQQGDCQIISGGSDVMVAGNIHGIWPRRFIDIAQLEDLKIVQEVDGKLKIGAAVTMSALLQNQLLQNKLPTLHYAISRMASTQIRNVATLAGNIANASPIADASCALLGLGAQLVLLSAKGERRVPLENFHCSYKVTLLEKNKEIISFIEVPFEQGFCSFEKSAKRSAVDIATVNSFLNLQFDKPNGVVAKCRLAFGGVAACPVLAKQVCEYLLGKQINAEVIEKAAALAAEEFKPIADVRGSAEYRSALIHNHVLKHLQKL
jgi:xanthine dehydrogenase small subunit